MHSHVRSSLGSSAAARRRGAALLATVLLCLGAATIALVALRAAAVGAVNAGDDLAAAGLADGVSQTRALVEARLASDPAGWLTVVWPEEQARVCAPTGQVVQPGGVWPASCGTEWAYVDATPAKAPGETVVAVSAPGDGGVLEVDYAASVGGVTVGATASYLLGSAARFTVAATESGVDLGPVDVFSGAAYAAGPLVLPSATVSSAQFGSPDELVGSLPSGARGYGPGQAAPVSALTAATPLTAVLQAGAATTRTVGCPVGGGSEVVDGQLRYLCLEAGRSVPTVSGGSVTVPDAAAFLLVPGRSGAGTVDVWAPTVVPTADGCGSTTGSCRYRDGWAAQEAAGTFPGSTAAWGSLLGTFTVPASRVVVTDADTYVSLCGAGATVWQGSCTSLSGSSGGVTVDESFTIVAGSVFAPADVWLSGPVHAGSGRLGVVATGRLVVPLWARPGGETSDVGLDVDVDVVVLNLTGATDPVVAWPEDPVVSSDPAVPAYQNSAPLQFQGSVTGPSLSWPAATRSLSVAASPGGLWAPPPWLPGPTAGWVLRDVVPMTVTAAGLVVDPA